MNWSQFTYLLGSLIAAAALGVIGLRAMPKLCTASNRQTGLELLFLGAVLSLGIYTIYFNCFSGVSCFAFLDVGNDTSEQYVPYYLNMLDSIRSGSLGFWNFNYGLGVSFMSYQTWTLDPFNLVLIPLGLMLGNSRFALALMATHAVKILVAGYLFDYLLTFYCEKPLARLFGSSLFAFSGFFMLWGQHYWQGSVYVLAVLILVLLERLLDRWSAVRFLLLTADVALSIAFSVYSGFVIMLFAAIYALFRAAHAAEGEGVIGFLRRYGMLALPVVCGILISCITVVPYATLMLGESTRVTGGDVSALDRARSYLTTNVPLSWIPFVLSRAMANGLVSYGSAIPSSVVAPTPEFAYVNVYETIMLGLSAGVYLLLSQFFAWAVRDTKTRDKALVFLATLLVLLYCFNEFLPALSNAMVNPRYRTAFYVVIPTCIALSVAWEQRVMEGRIARIAVVISGMTSLAVVIWSLTVTVDGRLACIYYLLTVCLCTFMLLRLSKDNSSSPIANSNSNTDGTTFLDRTSALLLGCFALIVSTSIADGFFSTNNRGLCTPSSFPQGSQTEQSSNTAAAIAWLHDTDPTFWRMEKAYSNWTWLNDSLVESYSCVSSYNSTLDSDVEEMYDKLWPKLYRGDSAYQVWQDDPNQPSLLSMLGVKYLLTLEPLDWGWCELVHQAGNVYVYRDSRASSIASIREGFITESEAESFETDDRPSLLGGCVIVPDDIAPSLASVGSGSYETPEQLSGLDLSWIEAPEWATNEDGQSLQDLVDSNSLTYIPESHAKLVLDGDSRLSGKLYANAESVVSLAIPHTAGWVVRVDGKEVSSFRANYGLVGFVVPPGVHDLEAFYLPPNWMAALAISCLGVVLAVASCTFLKVRQKQTEK